MSNIIPFSYQEKEIRIIEDQDGNPWWVAKDVCDALGIKNPTQAIEFLDDDERSMFNIGRPGEVNVISESGLYGMIGKKSGDGTPVQQLFFFDSVREVM